MRLSKGMEKRQNVTIATNQVIWQKIAGHLSDLAEDQHIRGKEEDEEEVDTDQIRQVGAISNMSVTIVTRKVTR